MVGDPEAQWMYDSAYGEWIRDHHSTFSTPPALVDAFAATATGRRVLRRQRILRGEVNEVYELTLSGGEQVIVRISHNNPGVFERGEAAITAARAAGVPVADTVAIDFIEVDSPDGTRKRRDLCLQRKVPGHPLDQLINRLSAEEIRPIIVRAGECLAALHQVPTESHAHPALWNTRPEWWLSAVHEHAASLGVAERDIDRALHIADLVAATTDRGDPRLVHADFSPKHFMIDNGEITGILDWDAAGGGHPAIDLAWWDMFFDYHPHPASLLIDGYRHRSPLPADHEVLRVAICLEHACGLIRYYAEGKNRPAAQFAANRLTTYLRRWHQLTGTA